MPSSVTTRTTSLLSTRFLLVSYLPMYAVAVFVLVLIWAGGPRRPVEFDRAWRTAAQLGVAEVVILTLAITLFAVVTHPFQLALVRFLQGEWPQVLCLPAAVLRGVQRRRRERLAQLAHWPADAVEAVDPRRLHAAGEAGTRLRQRFPAAEMLRPTILGNVLAATQAHAGRAYGWDAVVAWPRLYLVLGTPVRLVVDDRRNALDAASRLSVSAAAAGVLAVVLLARSGWWILLALVPFAVMWLSYRAAVVSAVALGEAVHTAFDLHRFDLLTALHFPLPSDQESECASNAHLCDFWRQGAPTLFRYRHPDPPPEPGPTRPDS